MPYLKQTSQKVDIKSLSENYIRTCHHTRTHPYPGKRLHTIIRQHGRVRVCQWLGYTWAVPDMCLIESLYGSQDKWEMVSLVPFSFCQPPSIWHKLGELIICFYVVHSLRKRTSSKIWTFCPIKKHSLQSVVFCIFFQNTGSQLCFRFLCQLYLHVRT